MWNDLLDKELMIINPKVDGKKDLFERVANHLYKLDYILDKKKFLQAIWKREKLFNTELIDGVAIPHVRLDSIQKLFILIITSQDGIDYEHSDFGDAKTIIFIGCSEKDNKHYLKLLARISRLLQNEKLRNSLANAKTSNEVILLLDEHDVEFSNEDNTGKYLILFTLFDEQNVDDILMSMVEVGITNASIIDTVSMAKKLAYEVPLFAGLSYLSLSKSTKTHLIMAFGEDKKAVYELTRLLKDKGIDLNKKGTGFIQLIKVEDVIGDYDEEIDL